MVKEPDILHEAGHGLLSAFTSYQQGKMEQVFTDGASVVKILARSKERREEIRRSKTSPADVIQMSGCKNYELSSDTVVGVCHNCT